MNRRALAATAVLAFVAVAGWVGLAAMVSGCGDCHMGPACTMGNMQNPSNHGPAAMNEPVQATSTTPAAGNAGEKPRVTLVNARCPIMGGKATDALTRDYKGQTVGFCCGGCPGQWDKLSDAEKDAKLAKVKTAAN